jgi:hypothetical protein
MGCRWYPQQDSNLRTRLRRPALYPLSYGGPTSAGTVPPPRASPAQRGFSLLVLVPDGEHQTVLHVVEGVHPLGDGHLLGTAPAQRVPLLGQEVPALVA